MKIRPKEANKDLIESIIHGIEELKGHEIVLMDMTSLKGAMCDQFLICHGSSTTQVAAIADKVQEFTKKEVSEDPWRTEGYKTAQWIILDYVNVVVHVFHKDTRSFYDLEELWADAEISRLSEESVAPSKVRKANRR